MNVSDYVAQDGAVMRAAQVLESSGHSIVEYRYPDGLGASDWFDHLWIYDISRLVDDRSRELGRAPAAEELEPLTWHLLEKAKAGGNTAHQRARFARKMYTSRCLLLIRTTRSTCRISAADPDCYLPHRSIEPFEIRRALWRKIGGDVKRRRAVAHGARDNVIGVQPTCNLIKIWTCRIKSCCWLEPEHAAARSRYSNRATEVCRVGDGHHSCSNGSGGAPAASPDCQIELSGISRGAIPPRLRDELGGKFRRVCLAQDSEASTAPPIDHDAVRLRRRTLEERRGGDKEYGPNFGVATVRTLTRKGYRQECPNVTKFLENLHFDIDYENVGMNEIMTNSVEPIDAARKVIKQHRDKLTAWLDGVKTFDGNDGHAAAKAALLAN